MSDPSTSRHASTSLSGDPADSIYAVPTNADHSLGETISPDDWRLYHLMRELPNEDRARIIAFAELLFELHRARDCADSSVVSR